MRPRSHVCGDLFNESLDRVATHPGHVVEHGRSSLTSSVWGWHPAVLYSLDELLDAVLSVTRNRYGAGKVRMWAEGQAGL